MAAPNRVALARAQRRSSAGALTNGNPVPLVLKEFAPKLGVMSKLRSLGDLTAQMSDALGAFNPERISISQKLQMRRDPMVALGMQYLRVPLIMASYEIKCDDQQVAAFVENAYRPIHARLIFQMMTSREIGYAGIVKRFQAENPDWTYTVDEIKGTTKKVWPYQNLQAVTWNDPRILDPNGATPEFKDTGDEDVFSGISHSRYTNARGERLFVPVSHALWVTNERDGVWGDWFGYPRTGYVYRYWWTYWYFWMLYTRHVEQDADPPLKVSVPEVEIEDPDAPGETVSAQEMGERVADGIRNGSNVVMPSTVYVDADDKPTGTRMWDAEFMSGGENVAAFHDAFEYLDVMKLRAMLIPEQALVEGKGGTSSRNVAATYSEVLAESLAVDAAEFDQIRNDYLIPDLVAQNFASAPSCRIETTGFREEDETILNGIVEALVGSDPASLSLDLPEILKRVGVPQLSPEEAERLRGGQEQLPPGQEPPVNGGGNVPPISGQGQQPAQGDSGVTIDGQELAAAKDSDLEVPDVHQYSDDTIRREMERIFTSVDDLLSDVYEGAAIAVSGEAAVDLLLASWVPSSHPRWPKGSPGDKGGEFREVTIKDIRDVASKLPSGSVNMRFLAEGSQHIRNITAKPNDQGGVDFHVEASDGAHEMAARSKADISQIQGGLKYIEDRAAGDTPTPREAAPSAGGGQFRKGLPADMEQAIRDVEADAELNDPRFTDPTNISARSELVRRTVPGFGDTNEGGEIVGDTETAWSIPDPDKPDGPRLYHPERKRVHDEIIDQLLRYGPKHPDVKAGRAKAGDAFEPQKRKVALWYAGGPASGKTTAENSVPGGSPWPPAAVHVDPDHIKTLLPEYDLLADAHDRSASSVAHEESSTISKRLIAEARRRGLNVAIDGTGDSKPGQHGFVGKMSKLADDYETRVFMVDAPTETALARSVIRGRATGRYLGASFLRKTHRDVVDRHLEWRDLDWITEWQVWSTDQPDGSPAVLLAEKTAAGGLKILDPTRYAAFLKKAGRNAPDR